MEIITKQLDNISSYALTNHDMGNLLNNHLQSSIDVVNVCLKLSDKDLSEIFKCYRKVFLMITKLALHLLSNLKDLKGFQRDHLYNIGLLTIKIMHNSYIYGNNDRLYPFPIVGIRSARNKENSYVISEENFYDAFFRYRFQSNNLTECLLQHIQNIQDSSFVQIICLWLDIVVHYQHVVRKQKDDLKYNYFDPTKIVSECIIKQKYNLPNDSRLCGSFLFYLAYIPYPHINDDEKLASICRQQILSQTRDLNEWTSDTIHYAMGSICLITKHYFKYFKDDEKYHRFLLLIVSHEKFQETLLSTWSNDETILIHTITKYFYENIDNNEKMKFILGTAIDNLHKLYKNVNCEVIKLNICYLILASIHEESNVSDETLLTCFQCIKHQYGEVQCETKWDKEINRAQTRKFLEELEKACHYDSIKNAIIRLNKIDELINLIKTSTNVICNILALLSTKSDAQKILRGNHEFIHYIRSYEWKIENKDSLRILQENINYKDHSNDKRLCIVRNERQPINPEKPLIHRHEGERVVEYRLLAEDQLVLSCSNTNFAINIKNHLQKAVCKISILNECNNDMEKETLILTCKCLIICLTDDYNPYQSELIIAYKNQVKIIPIVMEDEKEYCPSEPFLKFILEKYTSSLIRTNTNELDHLSVSKIEHILQKQANMLCYSTYGNHNSNDLISQSVANTCTAEDLYRACKENDIDKVKEYLQNINIDVLNKRISNGSTALHITSYNGHNEIVRLLLKAGGSRSIRNRPYNLTACEESRTQSTKDLFRMKLDDEKNDRFISDHVYIEWMTAYRDPRNKQNYLRRNLERLQTHKDYNTDDVYKELIQRMCAYISTLPLTNRTKQILKQYFTEMEETLDPVYIIKVYTSTHGFHKYYNEYIAQHGIDFFDPSIVDIHVDYSTVKSLMTTIAIVMYDKRFYQYRYCGETYRGMVITEKDLYKYVVNSKIMNKSFLSTSKSKEIAEAFSGCVQENFRRQKPDKQASHLAAFCTYIIKNPKTALNIEPVSELGSGEAEVLILPFSIFEVKSVQRSSTNTVNILLEELSGNLLENYD